MAFTNDILSRSGVYNKVTLYSPYLFILMEDVLSRMINVEFEGGRIVKFYHPRGCHFISHLLYADDQLVFTNGAIVEDYRNL